MTIKSNKKHGKVTNMTEIIILGTFHFNSMPEYIFSQKVQQELDVFTDKIKEIKPTKIAVEIPKIFQNELDSFYADFMLADIEKNFILGTVEFWGHQFSFKSVNEVVQVAFRSGRKLGLEKIYAVDYPTELSDELEEKIKSEYSDYEKDLSMIRKMNGSSEDIISKYRIHNSEDYIFVDNGMFSKMNKVNLGNYEGTQYVLQWYDRNLRIFSNLQNICKDGDRVLLLIGSSHLKILKDLVNGDPNMILLENKSLL